MRFVALLTVLLCLVPSSGHPQEVVRIGTGSYASHPPASEGDGPAAMLTREIYVLPGEKRPIPTNDWWTDLLVSRFVGDLWAYPLTVKADESGLKIFHPTRWDADGGKMLLENPLEIVGDVDVAQESDDILLADFEGGSYPSAWKKSGRAFGSSPAAGAFPGQMELKGFLGSGVVNSMLGGDGSVGRLVSGDFVIQRRFMHFLISGGNHPGETCVNLIVNGETVRTATGENSEHLKWTSWDVAPWKGRRARIEIADDYSGGWGHVNVDHILMSDAGAERVSRYGSTFAPRDARAVDWGDWTLTFRLAAEDGALMDVTMGRGMPYTWVECKDVTPVIKGGPDVMFFDASAKERKPPFDGDHIGVRIGDKLFAVFTSPGCRFQDKAGGIALEGAAYFVVSPLTREADIHFLRKFAYAIPRGSRMEWDYCPESASVTTRWKIKTEPLDGQSTASLQGWLPHHYREPAHDFTFAGPQYATPRGVLKCAVGNEFTITYNFNGLIPHLPAPPVLAGPNPYDEARMRKFLSDYADKFADKNQYGGDTYWGGKDLVRCARYMQMAAEMKDESFLRLKALLTAALKDWLTYTPGEEEHFFARYPNWGALIGFNESYWSHQFTDNHFHYGYFTTSAAILGMYDRDFLREFGPMIRLVAKQYANWDREDPDFPFLRTFDVWAGHSWAGGFSSPGGNNQESSSEAMQSWGGLFLLGLMMDDERMMSAGAMGYAIESVATREYWFNVHGDNWSPDYPHPVVGILFGGGQAYATYFSGDPAWIAGIQWLPASTFLNYLMMDAGAAQKLLLRTLSDRKEKEGSAGIDSMGSSLGNVVLGYAALAAPEWAVRELDALWDSGSAVLTDTYTGGISYYMAHAQRRLGEVEWDTHLDLPASTVYRRSATRERRVVVYNPGAADKEAKVYYKGKAVGRITVPAGALLDTSRVTPLE
ncbi:MAG: hypothetical protein KJ626_01875 [Verrucomicrobia bacterium]|nr:hypothetical protein [Verrucomicrobiota bacterium]